MLTINLDTKQVYENLTGSIWDMAGDLPDTDSQVSAMMELLPHYFEGDIDGIRQSFKDGFAFILVPDVKQLDSDEELEIRVHHRGKLIGVIINSEIVF